MELFVVSYYEGCEEVIGWSVEGFYVGDCVYCLSVWDCVGEKFVVQVLSYGGDIMSYFLII